MVDQSPSRVGEGRPKAEGLRPRPPEHGTIPADAEATGPAYNTLAPLLSMLARASEIPLQDLARRAQCSPSYLSRILSGQRVPSWAITERLAKTCKADPAIVRKAWETEQLRRLAGTPARPRPPRTASRPPPSEHSRPQPAARAWPRSSAASSGPRD